MKKPFTKIAKPFIFAFICALIASMPASIASVPRASTDASKDPAIYKNLREIRIAKEKSLDFDRDIERLSAQEKSHRKALPLRLSQPMERVIKTSYKPSQKLERKSTKTKNQRSRSH